jgi:hypothetical protein
MINYLVSDDKLTFLIELYRLNEHDPHHNQLRKKQQHAMRSSSGIR